ncbi:stemmadenine O-acetyltransferase [Jatropha curcas]|uniref:stemmadenine O-acetyltransferase n=1 Tax=Jatropha curcas TaxID=180498 RepID=UPI001894FA08|nr:stemmadenine O-acetyltransferase [Jatropha curcas]
MEVEIISKSCISPSSPTPSHLKTYKISLLDQFEPSGYFSTILFYQSSQETSISVLLKQSLSEALSRFYPLAGKVKDGLSIDCNDEGLFYTEATTNISLSQWLTQPDLTSLNKLMPNAASEYDLPSGSHVALIQETTFACGGFAIGILVSHMVCDASSLFLFLKDWAATACKSAAKRPYLEGESIFPQYTAFPTQASNAHIFAPFAKKGKHITKRIVFKESAIANLKAKARLNNINNPTRVEVSITTRNNINKPLGITHVVNLRRKGEPPLPECLVGNCVSIAGAVFTAEEELNELVTGLREAIRKVGNDFLKKIKSKEDGFLEYYDAMKEIGDLFTTPESDSAVELAGFSSWCNFGAYDIEFGRGKPIWAACAVPYVEDSDNPHFNMIILMDTRTYKGVEAWVSMNEDDLDFLEKDEELLQYASVDPSPIYN